MICHTQADNFHRACLNVPYYILFLSLYCSTCASLKTVIDSAHSNVPITKFAHPASLTPTHKVHMYYSFIETELFIYIGGYTTLLIFLLVYTII